MTKKIKRSLSLFLSIILILSTLTCAASALDFTYSANYYLNNTDNQNASAVLDAADKMLAENFNIKKQVILVRKSMLSSEVSIDVDFSCVDGLCRTIDSAKELLSGVSGITVKQNVGDLKNVNFSSWMTGMERGAQDYTIVNELIELAAANTAIVGKLLDGSLDTGVVRVAIDPEDYLGPNGFSGLLKKLIVGRVYDKNTNAIEFNKAYDKAVINFDTFVYEDVLRNRISDKLPNFSMDSSSSFDTVLSNIFNCVWETVAPKINSLNINLADCDNETLKRLANVLVLDGKQINTALPIKSDKMFCEQVNDIVGYIVKQIAPKYNTWVDGNFEMLGRNLTSFCYYIANAIGINTLNKREGAVAFELLGSFLPIIQEGSFAEYFEGVENCSDIKAVEIKVLRNIAERKNIAVTESDEAGVENILGDFLADLINQYIDLGYPSGTGADVWTVMNDLLNVVLFDNGFSELLGTTCTRSDSAFEKLDELIAKTKVFGETTPEKYKSEAYLKRLLNALINCDLNTAYDVTVINLIKDFGNKSVMCTLYDAVYNFLLSRFSVPVLVPRSTAKPLHYAVSNSSLKASAVNFLPVINKMRDEILSTSLKIISALLNKKKIESVKIYDQLYTGKPVEPSATVRFNGTVLNADTDYRIEYKNNNKPGVGTAVIIGKGDYAGRCEATFNIGMLSVTSLSAASTTEGINVEWIAVPGADRYQVYLDGKLVETTEKTATLITEFNAGTQCTVKVRAVSDAVGATEFKEASIMTVPERVSNLSIKSGFSGVILKWNQAKGAKGYEIEQLSGTDWKKLAYVTDTTYTVKTVKEEENCTFRVRATGSTTLLAGAYSEPVSIVFTPRLENVEGLTFTSASTILTLYWQGVDGADEYEVYVNNASKMKTSATSTVITNLEPGTQYKIKVRAVNHSLGASDFSEITATTLPENVGALKYELKSKTATVSWNKSKGAVKYEIFIDNALKATTQTNSCKISNLTVGKSYVVSVRAVNSLGGFSASSTVVIDVVPEKVTNLTATPSVGKIKLKWSAVDGATAYEIEKYDGSKWKKVTSTASLSYTVTGLTGGTKYSFRVRANSPVGYGAYSSKVSATPTLDKVKTLAATSATSKSIKLSWGKVKDAKGYVVEQKVGNTWKVIKKVTSTKFTVQSLSPNTTYRFRVRAYSGKTYGGYSSALKVKTTIAAPKNFKAKTVESKKITLAWSKTSSAKGYTVYVDDNGKWKKVASTSKTTLTVSGLKSKTSYKFKVRAYDSGKVYGAYSSALKVKTK